MSQQTESMFFPLPHKLYLGSLAGVGILAGGGLNADPVTSDLADRNFLDFRTKSTAASGSVRGLYFRHYIAGAHTGECARLFTTVVASGTTAHGAHISLSFDVSPATLSGLGVAMRGTLHIPNRAITLGTVAPVQAEIFMDGTSSDPTATILTLFRGVVDGGDATARNKVGSVVELVNLGSNIFTDASAFSVSKVLKYIVNGTVYYLGLSTAP